MKKKITTIGLVLSLIAAFCFFSVRSVVGWRPFKHFEHDDLRARSTVCIDLEEMKRESVTAGEHFIRMLNEIRVTTPYDREYDPWSMMYFLYQLESTGGTYHRIGVTYDPVPLIDIDGKVYRIDEETADRYRDFWENHDRAGYFKVGDWNN